MYRNETNRLLNFLWVSFSKRSSYELLYGTSEGVNYGYSLPDIIIYFLKVATRKVNARVALNMPHQDSGYECLAINSVGQ
jgi:hypothetical protein